MVHGLFLMAPQGKRALLKAIQVHAKKSNVLRVYVPQEFEEHITHAN